VETQDTGGAEYPGDVERESVNGGWVKFSDEARVTLSKSARRVTLSARKRRTLSEVTEREPVG
jgi:hypothetical protein